MHSSTTALCRRTLRDIRMLGLSCAVAPGVVKIIVGAHDGDAEGMFLRQEANLTPEQARKLAGMLNEGADRAEVVPQPNLALGQDS